MVRIKLLNNLSEVLELKEQEIYKYSLNQVLIHGKKCIINRTTRKEIYNIESTEEILRYIKFINKMARQNNYEINFNERDVEAMQEEIINVIREVVEKK